MRKLFGILYLVVFSFPAMAQPDFTQAYFNEIRGMEDSSGVTHLFYRVYSEKDSVCYSYNPVTDKYEQSDIRFKYRNIFHFNTDVQSDSLFIKDFQGQDNFCENIGVRIIDIEFFEAHPDSFFTFSVSSGFESYPFVSDLKNRSIGLGLNAVIPKIVFNRQSDSFIFGVKLFDGNRYSSVSVPRNSLLWNSDHINTQEIPDSLKLPFLVHDFDTNSSTLIAFREDSLLFFDYSGSSLLQSYQPFDNEIFPKFNFLKDTTLIYSSYDVNLNRTLLKINRIQQITIDTLISNRYFKYTFDPYAPQQLFVSDSTALLQSINFGESFEHYLAFDNEITGLYKKPNSDLLYVLTKEELLEVNTQTKETVSLKKLPVSNEPEPDEVPNQITLEQNYPNPFNPSTVIRYQLNSNQLVRLEVFDVTGRKVAVLVDGERKSAGLHRVTFDGSGLSSGVYFYRLEAGGQTLTQKMLLMK